MDKESLRKQIGKNILKYRHKNNYTQAQLAELMDVETSFIAHVESGKSTLSIFNLYQAAIVLHVSCDALLYEESASTHLENINRLLKDTSPEYIASVEKLVQLCISEFGQE